MGYGSVTCTQDDTGNVYSFQQRIYEGTSDVSETTLIVCCDDDRARRNMGGKAQKRENVTPIEISFVRDGSINSAKEPESRQNDSYAIP